MNAVRVFADGEQEFHCWKHFGDENRAIMDLLDLTWGYAIVEDRMQIGPKHHPPARFKNEVWKSIHNFSVKTPQEIRTVLEQIADELAGKKPRSG